MGMLQLNAVLGSLVVTLGFWLVWGQLPAMLFALVGVGVAALLLWRAETIGAVWAWATLLLGVESFAWPIATMVQVKLTADQGAQPTDEQMGLILTAVLFGLFSSIFWLTFSYGLFKRMVWKRPDADVPAGETGWGRQDKGKR
ncbi:MAG: hypothetical protein KGO52_07005 [Nitrospirota bacterium]|nr:hypothetical protein [Nitrospirota bacterium]MDE3224044.1 hypothetical protein [Nitrospirota bacterium]MDE3242452.1 hypothetical protein [Nitrospirota bacterium]